MLVSPEILKKKHNWDGIYIYQITSYRQIDLLRSGRACSSYPGGLEFEPLFDARNVLVQFMLRLFVRDMDVFVYQEDN